MKNLRGKLDKTLSDSMWGIRRYVWISLYGEYMREALQLHANSYEIRRSSCIFRSSCNCFEMNYEHYLNAHVKKNELA